MEQQQIVENNRLIARFVSDSETPYSATGDFIPAKYCGEDADTFFRNSELKFHSSWDWLMPVVEKIESMSHIDKDGDWGKYHVKIISCHAFFGYGRFRIGDINYAGTKIEAVYNTVIAFINWYNQQEKL